MEKMRKSREEEEVSGGLQTRGRKKRLDGVNGEGVKMELKEENGEAVEGLTSVYFDATEGLWICRHCDWTYGLSSPCTDGTGILSHGEHCQIAGDLMAKCSLPNPCSIVTRGTMACSFTASAHSTEVVAVTAPTKELHLGIGMDNTSDELITKVSAAMPSEIQEQEPMHTNIEENDLERILEEQETHDLYCPNCNSCITRRVILKKRKRSVQDDTVEAPTKKHQLEETSDVFRCLSCLVFFIPSGCGFDIFRMFEKKKPDLRAGSTPRAGGDVVVEVLGNGTPGVDPPPPVPRPDDSVPKDCGFNIFSMFQKKKPYLEADLTSTPSGDTAMELDDNGTPAVDPPPQLLSTDGGFNILSMFEKKPDLQASSSPGVGGDVVVEVPVNGTLAVDPPPQVLPTDHSFDTSEKEKPDLEADFTLIPNGDTVVEFPDDGTPAGDPSPQVLPTYHKEKPDLEAGSTPGAGSDVVVDVPNPTNGTAVVNRAPSVLPRADQRDEWDILKAIVYGGLVESITSLSVISSASASGAKTLNVFVLGMANLVGGFPIIFHRLNDLKQQGDVEESDGRLGRYSEQLGRRARFPVHLAVAMLSYLLFGLLPPAVYGFAFRGSGSREYKMGAVAGASLLCIAVLALAKAHVSTPRTYGKTLLYYLTTGVGTSGLSYVAGELITRLLVLSGVFDKGASAPAVAPPGPFPNIIMRSGSNAWASS